MIRNTTLGEVASIITGPFGSQLHMSDYVNMGIPVIMPQNIKDGTISLESIAHISEKDYLRLNRYAVNPNDIIFARRGDIEKHAFITDNNKLLCGTGCFRVRITDSSVYPLFLSFYLNRYETRKWLTSHAVGSNMPNLNTSILSAVTLDLPNFDEQVKIGNFLNNIEKKILCNKKINDNLQHQLKLMYDYWFAQFDFPDEKGKPYRSSGGAMVWNEQLKREIPVGWQVKPFLKIASWESNSQPPKSEFIYQPKEGYIRFIQNRDYESDTHITYIPYKETLSIADRFDILIDKYGDAGAVRYGIEGAFNVALGKIKVNEEIYQEYIRSFLENDSIYSFLHNSCMASTRASLNESNLSMLSIAIPEETTIIKYQNMAHQLRMVILRNNDETANLTKLRDWLLPMLMNGQVGFKNKQEEKSQINISGFEKWLANQGFAARGDVDMDVLRDIYEAMDSDDK